MMRYGVTFALNEVFFTHFHADHFLGIIGLVRTLGLQGRTDPMRLTGPRGAKKLLGQALALGVERPVFEVEIVEVEPGQVLAHDGYDLRVFGVEHGGGAVGYALVEHDRLGRFTPPLVLGVTVLTSIDLLALKKRASAAAAEQVRLRRTGPAGAGTPNVWSSAFRRSGHGSTA